MGPFMWPNSSHGWMKSPNLKYPPPLPGRPAFLVVDHPSSPGGPTATQHLHRRLVGQSSALHRFRGLHGQRSLGSERASSQHVPRDLSAIGGFRKMGSPQNEWGKDISAFMQLALDQAKLALDNLEVPVGCVIVEEGKVIASGRNRTNETRDATRHAEMEAIDTLLEQWQQRGSSTAEVAEKFLKCSLFVTCEPCIMCAAALSIIDIKEAYFGCANDKFGGCGSILSLHSSGIGPSVSNGHSQSSSFKCYGGIMASEAIALLRDFYVQGNPTAPKPHRQRSSRAS